MSNLPHLTAAPPAEVIFKRPNGEEVRFVKQDTAIKAAAATGLLDATDSDTVAVMNCAPYTASFNQLLQQTRPDENPRQLVTLVHQRMRNEGVPMNTTTYNLLLKRLVRFTDEQIFSIYEELKEEGLKTHSSVRPDVETYLLLFRSCERNADYSRAFVLYRHMRQLFNLVPETTIYNTLLGYCAAAEDVAQAQYLVEEMNENDVEKDVNTYNCIMSVLVDAAPYARTTQVFQDLMSKNLTPTNRTYNTILRAACKHGDYEGGFQYYEEMKRKGVLPDVIAFNYLLAICERRVAFVVHGDLASTIDGTTRRSSASQVRQAKKAIAELVVTLLQEMKALSVNSNTFSFNTALTALLSCDDERVFGVYHDMTCAAMERPPQATPPVGADASGQAPVTGTAVPPSVALTGALEAEDALSIGNIQSTSVVLTLETYKIIAKACIFFSLSSRVKKLYHKVRTTGLVPDHGMYMLLLEAAVVTKDVRLAEDLIDEMKRDNVLIDVAIVNLLLQVLCTGDEDEKRAATFEQLRLGVYPSGAQADTATYNVMVDYYCRHHPHDRAPIDELYATMTKSFSRVPPNSETLCIVLDWNIAAAEKSAAIAFADHLLEEPPIALTNEVIHHIMQLYLFHQSESLLALFQALQETGSAVDPSTGERKNSFAPLPSPDEGCYVLAMRYFLAKKDEEHVVKLFHEIKCSTRLEMTSDAYEVLVQLFQGKNQVGRVIALFDEICVAELPLTLSCYNTFLRTFVEQNDPYVYEVLAHMKAHSVVPEEHTMALFLNNSNGRQVLSEVLSRGLFYTHVPTTYV